MKHPKISVIIPTFNSWGTLKNCISSIQKQSIKPQEVLVIDNASTDDTSKKVRKYFPKVKLYTMDRNTGVTGGRNMGINMSNKSSDYLLFLDHDMVAQKDMIHELVEIAQSDPRIGIVTPKIYYWGNKNRIWSAGTGINLLTGQIMFRGGEDKGQFEKAEEVQVAPAAIFVTSAAMKKIKSFDDVYFACYEDTDFCFRARKEGFKTFYAPKALAYHVLSWHSEDDADRVLSRAFWIGRNRILFMKDFGRNFYIFLLFVPLFSIYYLKLAIFRGRISDWLKFVWGTFTGLYVSISPSKVIFSGERPSLSDMEGLHLVKYQFVLPFCRSKKVLELGCGSGYGSLYLAENGAKEIVAYDLNHAAINFAKENFARANIEFRQGDAQSLKLGDKYDVVISFEIIEHLTQPLKLLELVKTSLKKGGVFILSTPNREYNLQDNGRPSNPYHVYEYLPEELKKILLKYFKSVQLYGVILDNQEIAKQERKMQDGWRWRIINLLVNKRWVRRLMNYLPEYPKRLISGEAGIHFKTGDFKVVKDRAGDSADFVAVCK